VFCLDKTGDNKQGKTDGNRGGQKKVVPRGKIPKELVGVKDSHFTITPITDLTGNLRFVTVIFCRKGAFSTVVFWHRYFCRIGLHR
jgi:hypothetical protein